MCERSRLTGYLAVTVEKEKKSRAQQDIIDLVKRTKAPVKSVVSKPLNLDDATKSKKKLEFDPAKASVVDYRTIVCSNKTASKKANEKKQRIVGGIVELDGAIKSMEEDLDFVDDPDVPPLC